MYFFGFPGAVYVGVADGAPDNWAFLESFRSVRILDYYQVFEYVADVAEAVFSGKGARKKGRPNKNKKLHDLKH